MDLKQAVVLALQVSIMTMVLGFGLRATRSDLVLILRRPALLARSLLSVFVVMPIVTGVIPDARAQPAWKASHSPKGR